MILPIVRLVIRDGSGALGLSSVAWRWSAGDDVTVQGRLVAQDGTPHPLSDEPGDALSLAFWRQDSGSAFPDLQIDAVRFSDDDPSLAIFDVAGGSLLPGEYEVGMRYREDLQHEQVLAQSRLVVDADRTNP